MLWGRFWGRAGKRRISTGIISSINVWREQRKYSVCIQKLSSFHWTVDICSANYHVVEEESIYFISIWKKECLYTITMFEYASSSITNNIPVFCNYKHREANVAFLITDISHIFMYMGFLKDVEGKDERKEEILVSDILSHSQDRLVQVSTHCCLFLFLIVMQSYQHLILRKTAIAINSRIASCQLDSTVCQDCHPCYENLVFLFLFWKSYCECSVTEHKKCDVGSSSCGFLSSVPCPLSSTFSHVVYT